MKSKFTHFLPTLGLAFALTLGSPLRVVAADETTEPKPVASPAAPAQPAAPADQPAAVDQSAVAVAPTVAPVPPAAPDVPADADKPATEAATEEKDEAPAAAAEEKDETPAVPAAAAPEATPHKHLRPIGVHHRDRNNERVSFGQDSKLAAGEQADAVVSIFGSSISAGEVGDAVVSIGGGSRVTGGTVGGSVVSVLGTTYVNGHVNGEAVAVLGNLELGPDAVVEGQVVCVGGEITRDPKAVVHGTVQNVAIGGRYFNFTGLNAWFSECLLYARPLAFDGRLLWAWWIAAAFLGLYALIALIAPAGVVKCAETLEQRPGYSLLSSLLTLLLTPVAYILLALTLFIAIGFVLIPVFTLGLFCAAIFGKVVLLAWLGRRITKLFGDGPLAHPVFGVLIGGVIVLGLYTIPVVGFIMYKLIGVLGLGVVVYTLILQLKASRPPKPPVVAVPAVPPAFVAGPVATPVATDASGAVPPLMGAVAPALMLPVISAATLPRAGFWLRVAAALLDVILIAMVSGMIHSVVYGFSPGGMPFWLAIYSVAMWTTKGTTIGGIVCGLKVVRLDDRPLDWGVAIVRGLGAFLSLAVAGLGFIWVAFDPEKQSWHDKIAGTTIVRVPRGTSLI
jgi:uncharacterized RDD family membrane protein YckC